MSNDFFYQSGKKLDKDLRTETPWKILIADDDEDVHSLTRLTLDGFSFDNRPLQINDVYSAGETLVFLERNPDTAVLFLDVVMETEDAGLRAVKHIRQVLKNEFVRIVLRTGQPGQAPEDTIMRDYDINDYKDKTELTSQKMYTTLYASLRSYRGLKSIEKSKCDLIESQKALHQANNDLNAYIRELETLDGIVKTINGELDPERIFDSILSQGLKLFPQAERGLLWLAHEDERMGLAAVIGYHWEALNGITLARQELTDYYTRGENWGEGIYLIRAGDQAGNRVLENLEPGKYMLAMLLILDQQVKGCLVWDGQRPFDRSDASRLRRFSQHAVAAVAKARILKVLETRQPEQELSAYDLDNQTTLHPEGSTNPRATENMVKLQQIAYQAFKLKLGQRKAYVLEACGTDQPMYLGVMSLLESPVQDTDELRQPLLRVQEKDTPNQLAGKRIGPYKLKREVGRGGMGSVYLAERVDTELRMKAAIKLINRRLATPAMIRRFLQERQVLADLRHPYIGMLLDAGSTDEGLPYFIMEYVAGETIEKWCANRKFTTIECLQLFRKVLHAVSYAHDKGVIHRDLKPGNIMVSETGDPKLLDFGIARLVESGEETALTLTGQAPMTPEYAAPEQLRGMEASPASDIYSLGLVLFQILLNTRPHRQGPSPKAVVKECYKENPLLANILCRMLEEDIQQRFSSCELLAKETDHLLAVGNF